MYDILIKNGIIFDGSGKGNGVRADIGVEDNRITAIKDTISGSAHEVIDAEGLYIAPGFIDIQNHSDSHGQILIKPALESMVSQGATSIIVGQCGASIAPLAKPESMKSLQKWGVLEGINADWQSYKEFLQKMKSRDFGTNVGSFVGHATLRRIFTGDTSRSLSNEEINQLGGIVDEALRQGAFGVSFGFQYGHEINTSGEELAALLRLVKKNNKIFSVHLRSQGPALFESTKEMLEFVRATGVKTKIAHFKVEGRENYNQLPQALNAIEQAYQSGFEVRFDSYPYSTSWHSLYTYLPPWAYMGGFKPMLNRIKDRKQQTKIIYSLSEQRTHIAALYVTTSPKVPMFVGKTINQIARAQNTTPEEALLRILSSNGGQATVFDHNISDEQIELLIKHPFSMVATDGIGYPMQEANESELPHPRCFGTFARYLGMMKQENQDHSKKDPLMTWAAAIAKITSIPAQFLGIKERGMIKNGYFADLVIFDPNNVEDRSDYHNPYRAPNGINFVIVNGKISLYNGQLTGVYGGTPLKS